MRADTAITKLACADGRDVEMCGKGGGTRSQDLVIDLFLNPAAVYPWTDC